MHHPPPPRRDADGDINNHTEPRDAAGRLYIPSSSDLLPSAAKISWSVQLSSTMNTAVEVRCAAAGGGGVNAAAFGRRMMRPAPAGHCRVIRAAATSTVASGRGEDDYYKVLSLDRAGRWARRRSGGRTGGWRCGTTRTLARRRAAPSPRASSSSSAAPTDAVRPGAPGQVRRRADDARAAAGEAGGGGGRVVVVVVVGEDVWEAQLRTLRALRRAAAAWRGRTARRGRWFEV